MMSLQDVRLAVKIQCNYNCEKYLPKIVTFISQCEKFYIVLWVIQIIQRMEKSGWKVVSGHNMLNQKRLAISQDYLPSSMPVGH